ncbi:hypothetical protein E4U10_004693 [Claviceps purpurea]|nr:hypothetical protein E4U10_004693 [Claviceps purpurea]
MQFALLVLHTIVSMATCTTLLALGLRFGHTGTTSRLHLRGDALPCDEAATVSLSPSTTASTGTPSPVARISADEPSVADENADTLNLDLVVLPAETAAPAPGATFRDGSCLAAVVFIVAALMLLQLMQNVHGKAVENVTPSQCHDSWAWALEIRKQS